MVRHTETIRRKIADELSVFDHFVGLALKGLKHSVPKWSQTLKTFATFPTRFLVRLNILEPYTLNG